MPSVGVLIFFAIVGAVICARARVAGAAIVFALIAVVLFVTTPVGQALPGAVSTFVDMVGRSTGPVLGGADGRGAG